MMTMVGRVETEPVQDGDTVGFTLSNPLGGLVLCVSARGYRPAKPKKGDTVSVAGERRSDLLPGSDSFELVYVTLDVQGNRMENRR